MSDVLLALREEIDAEGGLLAGALRPADEVAAARPTPGPAGGPGPRVAHDEAAYAFVVEAIREGELLHHGGPRVLGDEDADLALLAGDRLYALGLQRLAELGDLEAVAALADVIALSAQAFAAHDEDLVSAVWEAGLVRLHRGDDPALQEARKAAQTGDPSAAHALRMAAQEALARPHTPG